MLVKGILSIMSGMIDGLKIGINLAIVKKENCILTFLIEVHNWLYPWKNEHFLKGSGIVVEFRLFGS